MTGIFFWCATLAACFYFTECAHDTLLGTDHIISGGVTEPVVRDTQECRNVLFT